MCTHLQRHWIILSTWTTIYCHVTPPFTLQPAYTALVGISYHAQMVLSYHVDGIHSGIHHDILFVTPLLRFFPFLYWTVYLFLVFKGSIIVFYCLFFFQAGVTFKRHRLNSEWTCRPDKIDPTVSERSSDCSTERVLIATGSVLQMTNHSVIKKSQC